MRRSGNPGDFEGDPRPYRVLPPGFTRGDGSGYDIGADEFVGTVTLPPGLGDWLFY